MDQHIYGRVIQEWADATGMSPWPAEDDMHIEVDGTLVGLVYGGPESPHILHVYIDLGLAGNPDLHRKLLETNLTFDAADAGCFGVHAPTGAITYRTSVALDERANGGELPARIAQLIDDVRARLHST